MNKQLLNVLSTAFVVVGLAGCGVAKDEAGNNKNKNLTPVGYDNRTDYGILNVDTNDPNDPIITPTNDGNETPGTDGNTTPPATGGNETPGTDGNTTPPATGGNETPGTDGNTTPPATGGNETPGTDGNTTPPATGGNETPGTDENTTPETDERTENQTPGLGGNVVNFEDVSSTNPYVNDINSAQQLGLMNGIGNNKFGFGQTLTREQMASILMKMVRKGYIEAEGQTGTTETANGNTTNGTR